jgi:hypothetical protein
MRVARRRISGTVFDEHSLDAFARYIWQSILVDERGLWMFISGYRRTATESGVDKRASDKRADEA